MSKRQRRRREKQLRRVGPRLPNRRQLGIAGGVTLGATFALGGTGQAATFTVTNTGDSAVPGSGSLRDALNSANTNPGSTITFASGITGTITLGSQLPTIYHSTTIQGPGASQLTVSGNSASRIFDAISVPSPGVTISGLSLTNGKVVAGSGGAIHAYRTALSVSNSVLSGNTAHFGGAIKTEYGSLTVQNSTVSGNSASQSVAGLDAYSPTTVTVQGSTISGNIAGHGTGGAYFGAYSGSGTQLVQNSTITGNKATNGSAGGLYSGNATSLTIQDSTIAGNSASTKGGGVHSSYSPTILKDTIISGNSAPTGPDLYVYGSKLTAGFSLIQNTSGATINQSPPGSDITGVDPMLGPLANSGGPTQTMSPLPGSPAINKGAAFGLTTDQRGALRPVLFPGIPSSPAPGADGSDIGAVEVDPGPSLGKVTYHKKKGTATAELLNVLAPGGLKTGDANDTTLFKSGKKAMLRIRQTSQSVAPGSVKVLIKPTKNGKRKLRKKGKLGVTAKFIYTAAGLLPVTLTEHLALKLKQNASGVEAESASRRPR